MSATGAQNSLKRMDSLAEKQPDQEIFEAYLTQWMKKGGSNSTRNERLMKHIRGLTKLEQKEYARIVTQNIRNGVDVETGLPVHLKFVFDKKRPAQSVPSFPSDPPSLVSAWTQRPNIVPEQGAGSRAIETVTIDSDEEPAGAAGAWQEVRGRSSSPKRAAAGAAGASGAADAPVAPAKPLPSIPKRLDSKLADALRVAELREKAAEAATARSAAQAAEKAQADQAAKLAAEKAQAEQAAKLAAAEKAKADQAAKLAAEKAQAEQAAKLAAAEKAKAEQAAKLAAEKAKAEQAAAAQKPKPNSPQPPSLVAARSVVQATAKQPELTPQEKAMAARDEAMKREQRRRAAIKAEQDRIAREKQEANDRELARIAEDAARAVKDEAIALAKREAERIARERAAAQAAAAKAKADAEKAAAEQAAAEKARKAAEALAEDARKTDDTIEEIKGQLDPYYMEFYSKATSNEEKVRFGRHITTNVAMDIEILTFIDERRDRLGKHLARFHVNLPLEAKKNLLKELKEHDEHDILFERVAGILGRTEYKFEWSLEDKRKYRFDYTERKLMQIESLPEEYRKGFKASDDLVKTAVFLDNAMRQIAADEEERKRQEAAFEPFMTDEDYEDMGYVRDEDGKWVEPTEPTDPRLDTSNGAAGGEGDEDTGVKEDGEKDGDNVAGSGDDDGIYPETSTTFERLSPAYFPTSPTDYDNNGNPFYLPPQRKQGAAGAGDVGHSSSSAMEVESDPQSASAQPVDSQPEPESAQPVDPQLAQSVDPQLAQPVDPQSARDPSPEREQGSEGEDEQGNSEEDSSLDEPLVSKSKARNPKRRRSGPRLSHSKPKNAPKPSTPEQQQLAKERARKAAETRKRNLQEAKKAATDVLQLRDMLEVVVPLDGSRKPLTGPVTRAQSRANSGCTSRGELVKSILRKEGHSNDTNQHKKADFNSSVRERLIPAVESNSENKESRRPSKKRALSPEPPKRGGGRGKKAK